jgi:hypothetical protein
VDSYETAAIGTICGETFWLRAGLIQQPMQISISKLLVLLVLAFYVTIAISHAGAAGLKWSAGLLLPLACIWFPEGIGNLTGYFRTGYVNTLTPAPAVSFIGWFLLIGLPALFYLITKFAV